MKSVSLSHYLMLFRSCGGLLRALMIATVLIAPICVSASSAIQKKLDTIVFPQVNFSGMELTRVLETLSELSVEFDPEQLGVNIVPLFDSDANNPRVNISLRNLNLGRILNFVTQQVDFTYAVGIDHVSINGPSFEQKTAIVDPFAAPVTAADVDFDFNGANLIKNVEELKACALSTLAVFAEDSSDASNQDVLNSNAFALLASTVLHTIDLQSVLSDKGELTTLEIIKSEWYYSIVAKEVLQYIEEESDLEGLLPSDMMFHTLYGNSYIQWRYANAPDQPETDAMDSGEDVVSDKQIVDATEVVSSAVDPAASQEQSRAQSFLQQFGISLLTLKFLVMGIVLGALPFAVLKSRTNPVSRDRSSSLPQKSPPQQQPQKPRAKAVSHIRRD
ncbi:hypothetical protein N9P58_02380 [Puniceicoccaceae bacterium]|jgi:hypothetical protein|nr:hypothetical protein [Puniceicoccaceae bacterium]